VKLFKKIPLVFEEKNYEIRIFYNDTKINAVAFLNNYPANNYRHHIILPKKCDAKKMLNKDVVKRLADMVRDDIIEKRGEELSKTINEILEKNIQ